MEQSVEFLELDDKKERVCMYLYYKHAYILYVVHTVTNFNLQNKTNIGTQYSLCMIVGIKIVLFPFKHLHGISRSTS